MRPSIVASILLPSLIQALSPISVTRHNALTSTTNTPIYSQPTITSIPQPSPATASQPASTPELPPAPQPQSPNLLFPPKLPFGGSLNDFISNLQQPMEDTSEINARQAGVALGGGPGAAPLPVPGQLSPTTIYYVSNLPVTYVQKFVTPLDQGPTASVGSVGMGTLTGAIGVVKTNEASSAGVSLRVGKEVGWVSSACAMVLLGAILIV
ncbi:hypothetical protein MMC26_000860 [Xylographa opegraphella]|nr:hypothetical protein [Xylographa opegraphella]